MTAYSPSDDHPYSAQPVKTEPLPFRVRLALNADDIQRAVQLRADAYHRHVPAVGVTLRKPEPEDFRPDAILLLAESKLDDSLLGSVRLLTNRHLPLQVEHEVTLPPRFAGRFLLEARRLTVKNGANGRAVTPALIKAVYEICCRMRVDEVLITARRPVDLMYQAMLFTDVLGGEKICLSDVSNLPHGLYSFEMREADSRWRAANVPLYPFMAMTVHPDIQIDHDEVARRFATCPPLSEEASATTFRDDGHDASHSPADSPACVLER